MDLLPGALFVQQQRMQERWRRNLPEDAGTRRPTPHHGQPRRAVQRGVGRLLIVVGTALVRWTESAPSRPPQPIQRAEQPSGPAR